MVDIRKNIQFIQENILNICSKNNFSKRTIQIVAASKRQDTSAIKAAYKSGITSFGENYLQEAIEKQEKLQALDIVWHFIGAIQSRKCTDIAKHFQWVQSIASEKNIEKLAQARDAATPPLNILVQVNISDDPDKSGVTLEVAERLIQFSQQFSTIKPRGLMAITKQQPHKETQKDYQKLALFFQKIAPIYQLDTLSIGMSGDYDIAINCGANMIRLGTTIFGPRN